MEAGALRRFLESIPPDLLAVRGDGDGVRVAVIDSGVESSHPAIRGRVERSVEIRAPGGCSAPGASPPPGPPRTLAAKPRGSFIHSGMGERWSACEAEPSDPVGHGTACAGLILRLAPACRIWSVRVLGEGARGAGAALLAAIDWALAEGAHVVNMSLGTRNPELADPLRARTDRAYRAGAILVAAAGNLPGVWSFPSVFSSLIGVDGAAIDDPEGFFFRFGARSEIEAPGVYVRAPWHGGGERIVTGTSFACPHVSGHVARLLSANPGLRPFHVKTVLYAIGIENARRAGTTMEAA